MRCLPRVCLRFLPVPLGGSLLHMGKKGNHNEKDISYLAAKPTTDLLGCAACEQAGFPLSRETVSSTYTIEE